MREQMEKETPVTAEDFYHSQAEFNRWLRDLMPHEKSHLKYMLEEYASIRAEQARQEERAKILDIVKAFTGAVNAKLTCREMIAHMTPFFKAAGYELERVESKEAAGYEGKEEA